MTPQTIAVANAARRVAALQGLAAELHAHIQAMSGSSPDIGMIHVVSNEIRALCLGRMLDAAGRVVNTSDQDFAVEYVFRTAHGEGLIEICRFYLLSNGSLSRTPNGECSARICDWNNKYVAVHLLTAVGQGLLSSPAFQANPSVNAAAMGEEN